MNAWIVAGINSADKARWNLFMMMLLLFYDE